MKNRVILVASAIAVGLLLAAASGTVPPSTSPPSSTPIGNAPPVPPSQPTKPARDTTSGKKALTGHWRTDDGKRHYYFYWPIQTIVNFDEVPKDVKMSPGQSNSSAIKKKIPKFKTRERQFLYDFEGTDSVAIRFPDATADGSQTHATYTFSPDFSYMFVEIEFINGERDPSFKLFYVDQEQPPKSEDPANKKTGSTKSKDKK